MKQSGIYKITCIVNNKIYIGSAVNLKVRWKRHQNELKKNKHVNIILQNTYNKYGIDKFIFKIIEIVDDTNILFEREQFYLDTFKPFGKYGFNIKTIATGGGNFDEHPNKDEIYKKISKTKKEQNLIVSDEHKVYLSEKLTEYYVNNEHPNKNKSYEELYGVEKAIKIKEKISKHNKTECGENNPFYNKTHTQKVKDDLSKFHKGKYFGTQNIEIIINEKEFSSFGEAAKEFGITPAGIRYRCLSKSERFSEYKLKNE